MDPIGPLVSLTMPVGSTATAPARKAMHVSHALRIGTQSISSIGSMP